MALGGGMGSKMAVWRASGPGGAWGTPTSVNRPNAAIDYLSEDFAIGVQEAIPDASVSRSWPGDPIRGNISANGSFRTYLRYLSQEFPLAGPLGLAQVSAVATGVYAHRYIYTSQKSDFFTLAIDKNQAIHEYESVAFSGFTINWSAGRPTEVTFRALANNNVVPAALNTSLASATYRTSGHHVLFSQTDLLLNNKALGALTLSDRTMPSSVELTFDNNLAQHYVMNQSAEMIQPILDAQPVATLRLTYPRYATAPAGTPGNTFFEAANANTPLKLWLRCFGPTIAGTSHRHTFEVFAPNAFVNTVSANVGGPAAIPVETTLGLQQAQSAPTGMPSYVGGTGGFVIRVISGSPTAALDL